MTGMNFAPRSGGGGATGGYTSGSQAYFINIGASTSGQVISYDGTKIVGTPPVSTSGFATTPISGANWAMTVSGAPFATREEVSGALTNYAPKADVSGALQNISGAAWAASFSGQSNYYKPGSTISGANWAASFSGSYQVSGAYYTSGSNPNFVQIVVASGTIIQGKSLVIGSPQSGQMITFDGTNYTPQTPPGGGSGYTSGSQAYFINIGASTSGQFLQNNGSAIVGAVPPSSGGLSSSLASSIQQVYTMRLATTYSNALGSAGPTTLGFPIGANEAYNVYVNLTTRNMSAGVRYIVTAPAGAVIEGWIVTQSGVASNLARYIVRMSSINFAYGPFHSISGPQYNDQMTYSILNGGTAGSNCIICVPNTFSGQQVNIIAGAQMTAMRAIGV